MPSDTSSMSTMSLSTTPKPPLNADQFKATHQTESSITLQWNQPEVNKYDYQLEFEGLRQNITGDPIATTMNYTVTDLEPAKLYNFTLYTEGVSLSTGVSIKAPTAPENIDSLLVTNRSASSIRLQWNLVGNVNTYWVVYRDSDAGNTTREEVTAGPAVVEHTVSHLRSATSYNFTIYSQILNVTSSGYSQSEGTAPLAVTVVMVNRSLREVVLSWSRDGNSTYFLIFDGQTMCSTGPWSNLATCTISSLQEGTVYSYSITASYLGANSTTYQNNTVTTINCSAARWRVTNSTIQASVVGAFTNVLATNGSESHNASAPDPSGSLSFTDLYPGATYLLSVNYKTLMQCQHILTLPPQDIRVQCEYESSDAILLRWEPPEGVWTGVEVTMTGRDPVMVGEGGAFQTVLYGFQPAKTYRVSTCLLSGDMRSTVHVLYCSTDPRGVIAGSVLSVLVVLILVALGVFFWQRRSRPAPQRQSRTEYVDGSKHTTPTNTYQPIPADMFENHVRQLSLDDNRGFSEEYESFIEVGTDQTRHAAIAPGNKVKNRFTNVLPYDSSRVTLSERGNSNYINASYLSGYSGSKEYIAAQGPLAETLYDFWRMVWEQEVRVIAMVTNCTEGGRAKCEQYWPLDYTPCLYGDLLVTSTSEQRQQSWTIRTLNVKNRATSQQRSVQHFHFHAWPDHGVPDGTGPLLQFRALLRQQQMETEGTVDVASFVHKMRLSRPLMVQTESQYVFLHRCLLESMEGSAAKEEPAYQNWDMMYANATALQELPHRC
ncbi:hypothetical protein CRUP_001436 [Coryphaenoides rupestris]|nr:hypothetical protein CRUP_001436 [Coryphaenoides rupestris]